MPQSFRNGLKQTFRALRHRNFRLFIFGQVISLIGTWMQNVAQAWLVYRLTHSELLLGTVWFCTQIPVFALGSLGGLASDRYSRWKLVILTQVLSLLQALGLALLTISGRVQVWHVMAFAVMLGCINAFDMPARQSLIIHMTSKDDLLNADLPQLGDVQFGARDRARRRRTGSGGRGRRHLFPAERHQFPGGYRLPAGDAPAALRVRGEGFARGRTWWTDSATLTAIARCAAYCG